MVDLEVWKVQAKECQENFAICFNDRVWDSFRYPEDEGDLEKVVTILLYGFGRRAGDDHGLTDEEKKTVRDVTEKCIKHNIDRSNICIGKLFIHVFIDKETQFECPLIRVRSSAHSGLDGISKNKFIDNFGRVYEDWDHYLRENSWTKAWLCVPKDGFYRPEQEVVHWDQTKRGCTSGQFDSLSEGMSNYSTCILVAGIMMNFNPVTRPYLFAAFAVSEILSAPSQIYDFFRNVYKLRDRVKHEQSLTDTEAKAAWWATLVSFTSIFATGSDKLLSWSGRSGRLVYTTARKTLTVFKYTNLSLNGLGVVKLISELREKPNIEIVDVWQVVASFLIFAHTTITFETADDVIRNAQKDKINSLRKKLTAKAQQRFDVHVENIKKTSGARCPLEADMIVIKELRKIKNLEDFYQKFDE